MASRGFLPVSLDEESQSEDEASATSSDMTPLQRIRSERPNLFHEEPRKPPELHGEVFARKGTCPVCKFEPRMGWGAVSCSKCGSGDQILHVCLSSENPEDLPVLNKVVFCSGSTTGSQSQVFSPTPTATTSAWGS
ncbi:unnamed protein product [Polarella glacialis]|uniref:Uncharacterized protein n=1 Tax=Polarella glacialis TaxID=89957 RepID=A0A813KG80_POLGL|nr:unnamed protein product [Polarella glacialis]